MTTHDLIIRDGIPSDIDKCLQLNSRFHTEHVLQMTVQNSTDAKHITLRKQRLPRALNGQHPIDRTRLDAAIHNRHCFIVLEESASHTILGFVSMRIESAYRLAYLQDLVIDSAYRHQGLGRRLINVARLWANEHNLNRIILEVSTVNFPAINFAESQGFVYCGFNDQYLPNQDIALFYSLTL
jgi:ribosomal protein S18 acetylase RimI-like enzyme